MGVGAIAGIVGAVGSLASAGAGIAGSLTSKGPNTAEESSRINEAANQFILPFAGLNNQFWNINPQQLAQQGITFGLQEAPGINQFNMQQLQGLLGQALPGYTDMIKQMSANTGQLLGGNVPTDVQDQIRRSAAYQSLVGGTAGAGTGTTGAITARDLGLTSLQLQQQGAGQATNLMQLARTSLMPQPVNPLSLLPLSDLINASEWTKAAQFTANQAAFTAKSNAAAAGVGAPTQPLAGIGGAIQGLLGNLTQQPSGGGQSQLESIISALTGGGGGGGGGFSGDQLGTLGDEGLISSLGLGF